MSNDLNKGLLRDGAFKSKTVVITGGGTGLGKSMAAYLLELGAHVVIASRKQKVLEEAADELMSASSSDGQVLPIVCDVRKEEEVSQLLKKTIDRFGSVDALVNNAAGNFVAPTTRISANAFSVIVDIVLKGTANCTLAFGKHWISHKQSAAILNIVTTYAFTGSAFVVPSAAAKGGVLALTRSLAVEWGKYGIRSNAIAPGPFPTEGAWNRLLPGKLNEKFDPKRRVPLKRFGDHQELANLAGFLLSDFAGYINGEVITIDGGEWLRGAGQFNDLEALTDEEWAQL